MLKPENTQLAPDGQPFEQVTLQNAAGATATFMDWGATWLSFTLPLADGTMRELLLGCQSPHDYMNQSAYLGATVGRYANRIARAQFEIEGKPHLVVANQGVHQLHGGPEGFHARRWKILSQSTQKVSFQLFSADGDQGFPGNMTATVHYQLTDDNRLEIRYDATVDKLCPVNLTNHAYFNLNDAENGVDVRGHALQLNADYFLPVDREGIPNAPLKAVEGTSFDFIEEKPIGLDFLQEEQLLTKGYDHAFLLNEDHQKTAAILTALDRSLRLEVSTSQRALQVYTGNYLGGTPTRNDGEYADYAGIALETQALPDTPNHPEWQQYGGMTKAGETYRHWTIFRFL